MIPCKKPRVIALIEVVEDPEERVTHEWDAERELIERVLCEKLKLRPDLQEEDEKLKAPEELDSPKRCGDRPPRPPAIVYAALRIHSVKIVELGLSGWPGSRNVGRRRSEEDRRKSASALEKANRALKSAHKPFLDALARSKLGNLPSTLERALEGVLAVDLSGVPAHPGKRRARPDYSLSAQPQRALTYFLAAVYRALSGECPKPTKKRYGFYAFTGAMFEAMGMKGPSRDIVRAACEFEAKKVGQKTDFFAKTDFFVPKNVFKSGTYARMLVSFAISK